ncbi:hypothetical protein AAGS40_22390 [Paraburkholderia sp. PREW-6R]
MHRIKRYLTTAAAFAVGEALVSFMLLAALLCKLTARIGKSK